MAISNSLTHCFNCDETDVVYYCKGCSKTLCYSHLLIHRDEIQQNLSQFQDHCNLFRENLNDSKLNLPLIKKINHWEIKSIYKIKQTAKKCREKVLSYFIDIDNRLNNLFEESKQISKENKYNEITLNELDKKLNVLKEELNQSSKIVIKKIPTSFIHNIHIIKPLSKSSRWKQYGTIVAGGNGEGNQLNQLSCPQGICIDDDDQTIYVADCENHRIIQWKRNSQQGRNVAGGNGQGQQIDQLSCPKDVLIDKENNSLIIADWGNRRVMRWSLENNTTDGEIMIQDIDCRGFAMDKDGSLYISDCKKNEVRKWKRGEKEGILVAGGNGEGDQLNQFSWPTSICVDKNYSLYISDNWNQRIMKWVKGAKEGMIVAGGNGEGNSSNQFSLPTKVIVNHCGQIYVTDCRNHRVMCWSEGDMEGRLITSRNDQENQVLFPQNLSFDNDGNLYVSDERNHRIIKFELDLN